MSVARVELPRNPGAVAPPCRSRGPEFPLPEQQTPEVLGALQKAEIQKWWPIMKAAGIRAE
jgi:hypothetical protein